MHICIFHCIINFWLSVQSEILAVTAVAACQQMIPLGCCLTFGCHFFSFVFGNAIITSWTDYNVVVWWFGHELPSCRCILLRHLATYSVSICCCCCYVCGYSLLHYCTVRGLPPPLLLLLHVEDLMWMFSCGH